MEVINIVHLLGEHDNANDGNCLTVLDLYNPLLI